MIKTNDFINFLKIKPLNMTLGDEYIVESYKHKVLRQDSILIDFTPFALGFYLKSKDVNITIKVTELNNYKIIKDKENIAPTIFDNSLKTMINNVCTDIYTYQLKNIHYLCLNDYFGELISRHKIILKEIHQVYFKANMWLEITKDKQYILKWDTLI